MPSQVAAEGPSIADQRVTRTAPTHSAQAIVAPSLRRRSAVARRVHAFQRSGRCALSSPSILVLGQGSTHREGRDAHDDADEEDAEGKVHDEAREFDAPSLLSSEPAKERSPEQPLHPCGKYDVTGLKGVLRSDPPVQRDGQRR